LTRVGIDTPQKTKEDQSANEMKEKEAFLE
jgi:hypothetical protein